LPRNIVIIGTMNTADRSIALVDAAMRRRFSFVALHPSQEPANGVLRSWLTATNRPTDVADLLDELNARIEDDDFKIGPSYFMRESAFTDQGLQRIWRTSILPLLEEHHYGDGINVEKRYGLDIIRKRVADHVDARSEAFGDAPASADAD
jgi:5-methylcytosine-specific restriction protein B